MRKMWWLVGTVLGVTLLGCGQPRGPKLSMSTAPAAQTELPQPENAPRVSPSPVATARHHGRTLDEWGQALEDNDPHVIHEASRVLHILGAAGRPYLVRALESPNPETRRICLDHLLVADLKVYGEHGRQVLVKLAGDRADLRIRKRAALFLEQWSGTPPAPM